MAEEEKKEEGEEEKLEKKDPVKVMLITIVVIAVIFVGILYGNRLLQADEKRTYNNFIFTKSTGENARGEEVVLWRTNVQKGDQPFIIPFYYPPWELENITADPDAEQQLLQANINNLNKTVFITLEPDLGSRAVVGATEFARIIGDRYNMLNLPTHSALLRPPINQTAETQAPLVTCNDVNNNTIVIKVVQGPQNLIHVEPNGCIVLEGTNGENIQKVSDRFAYQLLGIMN